MPTGHPWNPATITAVQSASVVRELGLAGVLSLAAACVVGIGHKRADAAARAAGSLKPRSEQEPGT